MISVVRSVVELPDGRRSGVFRMEATDGIVVTVAEIGATLLSIEVPDREGRRGNVILGSTDVALYPAAGAPGDDARLGATCGRLANRTAGATFTLDGVRYQLDRNDGRNHLHGGMDGFGRRLWQGEQIDGGVELVLTSPDGEEGYPGKLQVKARFLLVSPDELGVTYMATTDRPTHVNIVSHPYFNLGSAGCTIEDHQLAIDADAFLPIDNQALPAGEPLSVDGTPFDFRRARTVGEAISSDHPQLRVADGFNHCFALRPSDGSALRSVAWLQSSVTGRTLTLSTNQPGLQLYTGNALGGDAAVSGLPFDRRAGLCLEAQGFPNAANRPDFPSTRLDPGGTYRSDLRLSFGTQG
jgi:aldose 1-epimerase